MLSPAQDAAQRQPGGGHGIGLRRELDRHRSSDSLLTRTGAIEPANVHRRDDRRLGDDVATAHDGAALAAARRRARGAFSQVQRMGNPLINELLIGTGFKDRFSMDQPKNDSQFATFFLDPALARVVNAAHRRRRRDSGPAALDLLPVVTYAPPIAAPGTPAGPVADLLRLNTGVSPDAGRQHNRLGLLGGDPAGFPNGRRLPRRRGRHRACAWWSAACWRAAVLWLRRRINGRLGDGVNVNDAPYRTIVPYLANAPSGRNRRHIDPGEPFCTPAFGGGAFCQP